MKLLLIILALTLTIAVLLACGPAAQQDAQSIPDLPSAVAPDEPIPTFTPWPTVTPRPFPTNLPTITPLPTDYVKPTDSPQPTPWPTLEPDPTVDPSIVRAMGESGPSLVDQVTEYTRTQEGSNYEVIARFRVLSERTVPIAEDAFEWDPENFPYMGTPDGLIPWVRSKVEVVDLLHGDAPKQLELMAPEIAPSMSLEVNQEYILFIAAVVVGPEDTTDSNKTRLSAERLEAFGGVGRVFDNDQAWVIEGSTAWRIPKAHFWDKSGEVSHLMAAKAGGESLSVAGLISAINAGVPSQ